MHDTMSSGGGTESKGRGFMSYARGFLPSILWGAKILSSPQELWARSTRGCPQICGFTGSLRVEWGELICSNLLILHMAATPHPQPSCSKATAPIMSPPRQAFPEWAFHPCPPAGPTSLTLEAEEGALWVPPPALDS